MTPKYPIPEYVTRGKTIKQLIQELQSFENQNLEVRLSLGSEESHKCISLVGKVDNKYCVLFNEEDFHNGEWQEEMNQAQD
jgi:hypothetical protein